MDRSPVNHQHDIAVDPGSDYGSDFTAEEEDLVNELLAKLPSPQHTRGGLAVTSIDDHEEPGAAKIPRILGRERWSRSGTPLSTVKEGGLPIRVDGHSSTAKGEDGSQVPAIRLTDPKALSRER